MNYQTSALWFYKPLYYLITLLSLGFTFFGLSSPLFYIMMAGLMLPIVVSMHLHNLSEAGRAWLIKDRSDWIVYVNGIPVEEQRSSLNNPCFASVAQLKQFICVLLSANWLCNLSPCGCFSHRATSLTW